VVGMGIQDDDAVAPVASVAVVVLLEDQCQLLWGTSLSSV